MDVERWLAFSMASLLIAVLPGPGVANIVGYALSSGRSTAFAAIAGAVAGSIIAMLVSLAGLGALVVAFPRAFTLVELAGAAYLVMLGLVGLARAGRRGTVDEAKPRPIPLGAAFTGSIAVSALNPKSIIFFIAFVPQFIAANSNYAVQAVILVATFASVVATTDSAYALMALRVSGMLRAPAVGVWVRRTGGIILISMGLVAAASALTA